MLHAWVICPDLVLLFSVSKHFIEFVKVWLIRTAARFLFNQFEVSAKNVRKLLRD